MDATQGDDAGSGDGLPYDLLHDILRRLPSPAVAESRRVCRAWRAAVDDSGLLTALHRVFPPRAFPGVFTSNYKCLERSCFYAPADVVDEPGAVFRHPLFQHHWASVMDHCNGLLLLHSDDDHAFYCACNPATARCARLPPLPFWLCSGDVRGIFLAFDPAVSRHHEVFLFPETMAELRPDNEVVREIKESVWRETYFDRVPSCNLFREEQEEDGDQARLQQDRLRRHGRPAEDPEDGVLFLWVHSSRTSQWESRQFVPSTRRVAHEKKNLADVYVYRASADFRNARKVWKSAEYWRGSLYVHCRNNILMILHISQGSTYDMIQLPGVEKATSSKFDLLPTRSILANYENGIRFAEINKFELQVWDLNEQFDGWTLTHQSNLSEYCQQIEQQSLPIQSMKPWKMVDCNKATIALLDFKIKELCHDDDDDEEESEEDSDSLWNSDEDNFIGMDESDVHLSLWGYVSCMIIGLHPHKDVLLLHMRDHVVEYHLSTSRMQCLSLRLRKDPPSLFSRVNRTFPYRPCYVDTLPARNMI